MRKVLLLVGLSMMAVFLFAPAAAAQSAGGPCQGDKPFEGTLPGDLGEENLRCFATQAQADAYHSGGSTASPSPSPSPPPSPTATASPSPTASASAAAEAQYSAPSLPATGGASPLVPLGALALIVGGGLLATFTVRR